MSLIEKVWWSIYGPSIPKPWRVPPSVDKPVETAVETLHKQFDSWVRNAAKYAGVGIQIALFLPASISLFFVGLFLSVGGLDYFLLIDKQTMLASLFIYAAILSSITLIVTFIPRLITRTPRLEWIARVLGFVGFSIYIIGLEYAILLALLTGCMLLWAWLRRERKQPPSEGAEDRGEAGATAKVPLEHRAGTEAEGERQQQEPGLGGRDTAPKAKSVILAMHQNLGLLKLVTSVVLLCCLTFGYLRGEHLREQPASMIIHFADEKQTPVRVTVIMSFDQGVLVFEPTKAEPPIAEPRLYPWDRIAYIASAPTQGGISQRLRDWRDAVRGWMSGVAVRRAQ